MAKVSTSKRALINTLKVYDVLVHFNIYELNRLGKFLSSPYFNRNEKIIKLFNVFDRSLRLSETLSINRGEAWIEATGEKEYSDQKFRKLCSDLLRLVEQFLVQEAFEQNPLHKADYLLQAIHERRIDTLTRGSIGTAHRLSEQYYFRPASYYYYQYAFERTIYSMKGTEIDRSKVINLEEIAGNLDTFFIAEKLRYYCYAVARRPIIDWEYDFLFMDQIIEQVTEHGFDQITPINLYYQIYLTQHFPEEKAHYDKLKQLIDKHISELPSLEAKEILDAAFNYCIQRINTGEVTYTREIFELYKQSISTELLFVNGILDPWNFRNVVVSGLRLGEYDWVEKFIEEYQDRIDEKYRVNTVSFHLANLFFYQKRYDKVLELLREVEYEDPSFNRNSKTMLLATYYELDEIEPLISLLSSFAVYLRRSKNIAAQRKEQYLNLIKFTRQLIRTPINDKDALTKLRNRIEETEPIVNKGWLLSKVDELLV